MHFVLPSHAWSIGSRRVHGCLVVNILPDPAFNCVGFLCRLNDSLNKPKSSGSGACIPGCQYGSTSNKLDG